MTDKRKSLLYDFYKELSGRFTTTDALMSHALPLIADYANADSILFFNWDEKNSIISQRIMYEKGESYFLQEDIFVDAMSAEVIKFLDDGIAESPALDYPSVYVLLKWNTPLDSFKTLKSGRASRWMYGVLRVERFKKNKSFSSSDKEILLGLARELSVKMNLTEIDEYNTAQLRRAEALNDLAEVFATSMRLRDSIEEILKNIQKSFRFDRTSLYLTDSKSGKISDVLIVDLGGEVKRFKDGDDADGEYLSNICIDISTCYNAPSVSDRVLTIPLTLQNKTLGYLIFDNLLSRAPISQEDVLSLRQFSSQIALAIDNARLFEKVQELSNYDELTKLPMRRFFNDNFSQEIYRSKRFNLTFSVLMMDIDHFKDINDTYGHAFGDEVLKTVSEVIRNNLRQTDMPCRYGGDEIVIMFPRTTGEECLNIAKRLAEKVRIAKLPERFTRGENIKLSISQGISVFPYDGEEESGLIRRADEALYHVKQHGRASWALYSDIAQQNEKDK
ncbi:MAG: sensor domain-containing diguanylate cyclase [Elusimicrobiota bacterium]|jgi:diguanylate cyclase (GGDEF)-like protein|nr:sensor domain-containing diguanylate cyclase [Elusimicrobiota bacterium]